LIHVWRDNKERLFELIRTRILGRKPTAVAPGHDGIHE